VISHLFSGEKQSSSGRNFQQWKERRVARARQRNEQGTASLIVSDLQGGTGRSGGSRQEPNGYDELTVLNIDTAAGRGLPGGGTFKNSVSAAPASPSIEMAVTANCAPPVTVTTCCALSVPICCAGKDRELGDAVTGAGGGGGPAVPELLPINGLLISQT
jgi:hypothetical protein